MKLTATALLMLSLSGCNKAQSQAPATGVIIRPGPSTPQPSPVVPGPVPPPPTQSPVLPKVAVSEHDTPLQLGDQTYHFRTRVQLIEASPGVPADETTEWWELRDAHGSVVYHQTIPVVVTGHGFDSTTQVSARVFTTKQGSGVLVEGAELPSAPRGGTWVQIFGYKWGPTKAATVTSFGPPISTDGEFMDIATDPRRQAPTIPGRTVIVVSDVLRFRMWTGNFDIIYPVLINWITGKVEPSWHCLRMTSHGQVDRCNYPIQVEPIARSQRTFLRLFSEPTEEFKPDHVVVEPTSKVQFLEAEVPISWSQDEKNIWFGVAQDGDTWLKVRIDGREGWIHTQEDFDAVGLPQSG
jgi:hypothetical protein